MTLFSHTITSGTYYTISSETLINRAPKLKRSNKAKIVYYHMHIEPNDTTLRAYTTMVNNPKLQSSAISPLGITLQQEGKQALDSVKGKVDQGGGHAAKREIGKGGRWCVVQGQHEGLHTARGRPSGHDGMRSQGGGLTCGLHGVRSQGVGWACSAKRWEAHDARETEREAWPMCAGHGG